MAQGQAHTVVRESDHAVRLDRVERDAWILQLAQVLEESSREDPAGPCEGFRGPIGGETTWRAVVRERTDEEGGTREEEAQSQEETLRPSRAVHVPAADSSPATPDDVGLVRSSPDSCAARTDGSSRCAGPRCDIGPLI